MPFNTSPLLSTNVPSLVNVIVGVTPNASSSSSANPSGVLTVMAGNFMKRLAGFEPDVLHQGAAHARAARPRGRTESGWAS